LLPRLAGRPVVVSPSATAWLAASTRRRQRRSAVVAIAGPHLDRGAQEVKGVGQVWPDAVVHTDHLAERRQLTKAMATANLVHIAAHGVHQTENPLFSSLRLADGELFAHELDQAGRAPEHVVLSACELGLATIRPGDEALGLTSVLLHLGTRSVVAGVARVGDDIAAETMAAYHRELARGKDSATALATALAANDADHPAPFVCFGAAWHPPAVVAGRS
jgi:CHAT domain-containing protein